jgi:KUP system potassium uptake protein
VEHWKFGITKIILHFGFMQDPDVPKTLEEAQSRGLDVDLERVSYYVGSFTLLPSAKVRGMAVWRERLYAFMTRNAAQSIAFYRLPAHRVMEVGMQVMI